MGVRAVVADMVTAGVAGYAGTKVMEQVSMALYKAESPRIQAKEDALRPGPPYQVAAKKTAAAIGVKLSDKAVERGGMAFHYGLAISWVPLYGVLRRRAQWGGPLAAVVTGAAMSAVADETLTPLLGFSAPNRAYPLATHARGVAAHLVFGAAVGALSETVWALTGRRPTNRGAGRSLGLPSSSMLPSLFRTPVVSREGRFNDR
jgi:hypothetical protein